MMGGMRYFVAVYEDTCGMPCESGFERALVVAARSEEDVAAVVEAHLGRSAAVSAVRPLGLPDLSLRRKPFAIDLTDPDR